jgi:hypothetical protein
MIENDISFLIIYYQLCLYEYTLLCKRLHRVNNAFNLKMTTAHR